MEIGYLLGLSITVVGLFIIYKQRRGASHKIEVLRKSNEELVVKLAIAQERIDLMKLTNQDLNTELAAERNKLSESLRSLEHTRAHLNAQQEKIDEQKTEIRTIREKFNKDFELIAVRILDEKTSKFTEKNRENLDRILGPLKENIRMFEEKIEQVYKTEAGERNVLQGIITQLMEQNRAISMEAQNLTRALKGDHKKQGNWGEVILEKILERSGLTRGMEYRVQSTFLNADGSRFQPDIVIDLPDDKHLIIDSKVSLIAYERFVNSESEEEQAVFARDHISSLRHHVNELASKNYSDLYKIDSPDFVILFVPIESCFSLAVQRDAELFNHAWEKRIVIVSPSTLLATLRTIASVWKQERQNRNVMEIARLSGEMYDKFVGFLTDMDGIGRNIRQSQEAYDRAMNKLSSGRGNLTITAEKIKKLGAKAGKQIEQRLLDDDMK